MGPCTLKKVKTCRFDLANAFGPAHFPEAKGCAAKEECNKYDLTADPCFWKLTRNDGPRCFAISSLPPIFEKCPELKVL